MSAVGVNLIAAAATRPRARPLRRLRQLPLALVIGGTVVAVLLITAVFGPLLAPDSATAGNIAQRLWNVGTAGHLLGTDGEGRDVLSRLIIGARPTMIAGIVPVLVGGILGTALGILAGMSRRGVRSLIMRTLDVFYAFPAILLAIAIGAALGPGVGNAIISLSIVLIAPIARVAESEVLQMRSADFMEAAYASGARRVRIARRHVLPNIAPPLIVYCTSLIGLCIVYAAGLSFLGLGVVPPHPDWGGMLNDLRSDVFTNSVLSLVPAIAIFIASIGFNLLGGGLRQLLNVRERDVAA